MWEEHPQRLTKQCRPGEENGSHAEGGVGISASSEQPQEINSLPLHLQVTSHSGLGRMRDAPRVHFPDTGNVSCVSLTESCKLFLHVVCQVKAFHLSHS